MNHPIAERAAHLAEQELISKSMDISTAPEFKSSSEVIAERMHDIACGHRVTGHEGKCAHLHGHGYRIHFRCRAAKLDAVGRVIDFSVMKERLCEWLERNMDHKCLIWQHDPHARSLEAIDPEGVVLVRFNPTAENIASYLLEVVGPKQLQGTGVELISVKVEETPKCSATAGAF